MSKKKHEDTTVRLDMTFAEAIKKLARATKREDSQAEGSGSPLTPSPTAPILPAD